MENTTDEFVKNIKSDLVKEIHKEVTKIKDSKELEVEYMTLYMRDLENREEGREEGREEAKVEIISSMIENGLPFEQIAKIVKMSVEEIQRLLEEYQEE